MPLIMAINPVKKTRAKKSAKKKTTVRRKATAAQNQEVKNMAARRKAQKPQIVIHKNPPRKRRAVRARTNPARRGTAKRAASYARKTFAGINVGRAAKAAIPMLIGALITKFAAKKFGGDPSAVEGENWTWKHYLAGLIGGFAGAFVTSAVFRGQSAAQRVFEGSMLLTGYKVLINEVAKNNPTLETWFGQEETLPELPGVTGYAGMLGDGYAPGQVYETAENVFVKGTDGYWRPVNDRSRVNGLLGDIVAPVNPTLGAFGDVVQPVNPTLGADGNLNLWNQSYPVSQ